MLKIMIICLIWTILWIPIGLFFPTHPHFPLGGLITPIYAPFLIVTGNFDQSSIDFDTKYIYFPALFYWVFGVVFTLFCQSRIKSRANKAE